jgi:hypothetical protein
MINIVIKRTTSRIKLHYVMSCDTAPDPLSEGKLLKVLVAGEILVLGVVLGQYQFLQL